MELLFVDVCGDCLVWYFEEVRLEVWWMFGEGVLVEGDVVLDFMFELLIFMLNIGVWGFMVGSCSCLLW